MNMDMKVMRMDVDIRVKMNHDVVSVTARTNNCTLRLDIWGENVEWGMVFGWPYEVKLELGILFGWAYKV